MHERKAPPTARCNTRAERPLVQVRLHLNESAQPVLAEHRLVHVQHAFTPQLGQAVSAGASGPVARP